MQKLVFYKFQALITLLALLSGCAAPAWLGLVDAPAARTLAPGEQATLHFFTNLANFDSGIQLQSGTSYNLKVQLLNNWIDDDITHNEHNALIDEKGFANSVMPVQWLGWTRRSRTHNWFELMLVQPGCKSASLKGVSDLTFDEASGSYNFVATCDGNLTLFVNDSYGFYSNNAGYANIGLTRVN